MEALDIAFDFIAKRENEPLYNAINKIKNYTNTIDSSQSTVGGTGDEASLRDTYYKPNNETGRIALLDTYKDISGNDTYGYGIEEQYINKKAGTVPEMELQFKEILTKTIKYVNSLKDNTGKKLNLDNNQTAALTSLIYNIGEDKFKKSDAWNKGLRVGDIDRFKKEAFDETIGFVKDKKGGRILNGLVNRRREEQKLFETPQGADKDFSAQPMDNVEIKEEPLDTTANRIAKMRAGLI